MISTLFDFASRRIFFTPEEVGRVPSIGTLLGKAILL